PLFSFSFLFPLTFVLYAYVFLLAPRVNRSWPRSVRLPLKGILFMLGFLYGTLSEGWNWGGAAIWGGVSVMVGTALVSALTDPEVQSTAKESGDSTDRSQTP